MDNFIISIILLAAVLIFTGINSFVICGMVDEITELIDNDEFEKARELWEKRRNYISLFVRDAEIDVVNAEMNASGEGKENEDGEAELSVTDLKDALSELRHGEKPSLFNIFIVDRSN